MKKIVFILSFVLVTFNLFSQSDKKKQKEVQVLLLTANEHYENGAYSEAAGEYEAIATYAPENLFATYMLAESFRHFFEYKDAEKWYKKALELPDKENQFPLKLYWYANMLKMNGDYIEAEKKFEEFLSTFQPVTPEEEIYLDYALLDYNGCVLALDELRANVRDFHFENLGRKVNTRYMEFAPALFGNDTTIVITSSKPGSKGEETYGMFGEEYADNYRFHYDTKHGWREIPNHKEHFDDLNTERNDGSGTLSHDGKKYYYTICDERTAGNCAIYVATFDGHKWHKPEKLNENINPEGVWNAQPSLTLSDDTMFFSSKRDGGFGMNDIYMSVREGVGEEWGAAVNLGDQINTPFVDMCPDYHGPSNSLFFSSNGHEGFGGLDIYQANEIKSGVRNMGLPFNSNRDDFYFVLGEDKGYLASNREYKQYDEDGKRDRDKSAQGHDDIYWFNYSAEMLTPAAKLERMEEWKSIDIEAKVVDAVTMEPVPDVKIYLESDGSIILETASDEKGVINLKGLDAKRDYVLKMAEMYPSLTDQARLILDQLTVVKKDVPPSKVLFENIYFDFDKSYIRPEAEKTLDLLIEFQRSNPNFQIELKGNTDSRGSDAYNEKLSQRRATAAYSYLINRGFPKSALVINAQGEGSPIAENTNEIGMQLNRRVEFYVRGSNIPNSKYMTYIIEKSVGLKRIGEMFNMTIEELKEANGLRSTSIQKYAPLRVAKGGIDEMIAPVTMKAAKMASYHTTEQIAQVDKNAKKDVIITIKNDKGSKQVKGIVINSFQYYQTQNAYNLKDNDKVKAEKGEEIYVVKPLDTLAQISKEFGMTVEEIKILNNLSSNRIQIGQRLRVKKK